MEAKGGDRCGWYFDLSRSPSERHFRAPRPSTCKAHRQRCFCERPLQQFDTSRRCRAAPASSERTVPPSPNNPADWPTPAIMLSLVFMVLFVNIAIYLVNTIGASTIDNLVCPITVIVCLGDRRRSPHAPKPVSS